MPGIPDPQKARKRATVLWDHYNEHGKLLMRDVINFFGQSHDAIYRTLSTNNIEGPPIWDSQSEKVKRKSEILSKLALDLNQDFLVESQVINALSIKPCTLAVVLFQFHKYHYIIPKILKNKENTEEITKEAVSRYDIHRIDEDPYPQGLPVLDKRIDSNGNVIYRIR